MAREIPQEEQVVVRANYELFIVALLVVQIINSIAIFALGDVEMARIAMSFGAVIATYLVADAVYRLLTAHNRRRFLFEFHGYLVLIGSLPIPFFALLRLLWYRLTIQRLRRSDIKDMQRIVVRKRAQNTLLAVFLTAILILEVSGVLIIRAEQFAPDASIVTAGDAIWWLMVTMATVGYGDMYPVTLTGRIVAVFVMVIGVSLFTVLTSFLAQNFMQRHPSTVDIDLEADGVTTDAVSKLDAIQQALDQQEAAQQASIDDLRAKLAELERLIGEKRD